MRLESTISSQLKFQINIPGVDSFPLNTNQRTLIAWATRILRGAGLESPEREVLHLLQIATGVSYAHLIAFPERPLSPEQIEKFRTLISRRRERVPTAYLTNRTSFLLWEFFVDERVIVPRPETEILVEAVAERMRKGEGWIADIGTGSGVIGICLALMLPTFRVLALDKSLRALEVARQNIDFHRCASRVFPLCGDLLSPLKKQMTAVVANLPYISTAVLAKLQPEVAKYEPRVALDGGADGLRLLTPLAERATDYLLEGGMVALEVGEGQARRIEAILASNPRIKRTEVISDYGGIERVVVGFC